MRVPIHIVCLLFVTSVLFSQARPVQRKASLDWNSSEVQTADQTIDKLTKLTAADRAALRRALTKVFRKFDITPKADLVANARLKALDLNGDGADEIIAQVSGDVCSPTGNCPFWVFEKEDVGFKVILSRAAVQNFTLQNTRSHGYLDLVLGMHGSATEQDLRLYRFSGGQYRNAGCYNASWSYLDKNGELRELKNPRITRCQGYR